MADITIVAAFLAGIASFLSPCILPLIPSFLAYLGGVSLKDVPKGGGARTKIMLNTISFVLGFVLIFSMLGVALNGALSSISYDLSGILGKVGGIIIILFGLFTLGLIRVGFLEREYKIKPAQTRYAYLTSFIFGATFAVSWTPCVGAILGSIFTLAITQPSLAFSLLFSYSLGLGVPFLLTGAFTSQASGFIRAHGREMSYINKAMGMVLVIIGVLVFTGDFVKLANLALAGSMLK